MLGNETFLRQINKSLSDDVENTADSRPSCFCLSKCQEICQLSLIVCFHQSTKHNLLWDAVSPNIHTKAQAFRVWADRVTPAQLITHLSQLEQWGGWRWLTAAKSSKRLQFWEDKGAGTSYRQMLLVLWAIKQGKRMKMDDKRKENVDD